MECFRWGVQGLHRVFVAGAAEVVAMQEGVQRLVDAGAAQTEQCVTSTTHTLNMGTKALQGRCNALLTHTHTNTNTHRVYCCLVACFWRLSGCFLVVYAIQPWSRLISHRLPHRAQHNAHTAGSGCYLQCRGYLPARGSHWYAQSLVLI